MIQVGQRFGCWTVVSEVAPGRRSSYVCRCDCGTERSVMRQNLLAGRSNGCGCDNHTSRTHGMTNSPEFSVWHAMKTRCYNPNHHKFPLYGGRGIKICDEWLNDFTAFYDHVGPRPSPKHTIERIDGSRGYEPGNVRWATYGEQNINRSNVILVDGVPLATLAKQHGLSPRIASKRWRRGWPLEKILTTPLK